MQNTETKGRGLKKMNLFLKKSITESENRAVAKNETFNKQNIQETENRFSFKTKIISLITILAFHVSFVLPFAIFSFLFSAISSLE
ncbi:hypothetical protein LEP1GSC074_1482, partial [Leptospira noguchii str. Hook]